MMKITGLSHLLKWENLHNWWLTKYFFAPLYIQKNAWSFRSNLISKEIYKISCFYFNAYFDLFFNH